MLKTLRCPKRLRAHKELSYRRRRIQLDIGFKDNLPAFLNGETVRKINLERSLGRAGQARLIAGIGAGNSDFEGLWLDMTAIAEGFTSKMAFQGFYGNDVVTFSEVLSNRLAETYPWVPLFRRSLQIYPIAQIMLAYTQVEVEKSGFYYAGRTQRKEDFREILNAAGEMMVPGKVFAIIAGSLSELEFRPLRPEGPKPERGFQAGREEDSDVRWIKGEGFEGFIVASLDSTSYTSVHAHTMVPGNPRHGGHIENALVDEGAEILLLKAHEILQIHCS